MSIVTKGALERAAGIVKWLRPAIDHAEWTRHNAIAAAVADIVLHQHRTNFSAHDRSGRTRLKATGFLAMLADVGQENPSEWIVRLRQGYGGHVRLRLRKAHRTGNLISFLSILLEEHDVAPGRCAEVTGVVVRISGPRESVIRHLVPFFARDLASFAADANTRVGEKSNFDAILDVGVLALIRALDSFADHRESVFPCWPYLTPAV